MNHRWKDISRGKYHREKECMKCGVFAYWMGGEYQCWRYWWIEEFKTQAGGIGSRVVKTFDRPKCKKINHE